MQNRKADRVGIASGIIAYRRQKAIVAQVAELLRQCGPLEAQLRQTRTLGAHLLDSTQCHRPLETGFGLFDSAELRRVAGQSRVRLTHWSQPQKMLPIPDP